MAAYAGIDIAKHTFDLATEPKQRTLHSHNDAKGIANAGKILRKRKSEQLQSVPGIGQTTASLLVTELPELGRLNRRHAKTPDHSQYHDRQK